MFHAAFYIVDMVNENSPTPTSILLGRPFLNISRTKIDVRGGKLSMEFDGEMVNFNNFYPNPVCANMFYCQEHEFCRNK